MRFTSKTSKVSTKTFRRKIHVPAAAVVHHLMTEWIPYTPDASYFYRVSAKLYCLDSGLMLKASDSLGLKLYAKECLNILKATQ